MEIKKNLKNNLAAEFHIKLKNMYFYTFNYIYFFTIFKTKYKNLNIKF